MEGMFAAAVNPLIPAWYDLIWSGLAVVAIAVMVTAFVSIGRAKGVTGTRALGWILVVLCLPFAGSIAWFLWGKPRARTADV
jgi:uncharacterized membrane protein